MRFATRFGKCAIFITALGLVALSPEGHCQSVSGAKYATYGGPGEALRFAELFCSAPSQVGSAEDWIKSGKKTMSDAYGWALVANTDLSNELADNLSYSRAQVDGVSGDNLTALEDELDWVKAAEALDDRVSGAMDLVSDSGVIWANQHEPSRPVPLADRHGLTVHEVFEQSLFESRSARSRIASLCDRRPRSLRSDVEALNIVNPSDIRLASYVVPAVTSDNGSAPSEGARSSATDVAGLR